jgi:hypothetical protein
MLKCVVVSSGALAPVTANFLQSILAYYVSRYRLRSK